MSLLAAIGAITKDTWITIGIVAGIFAAIAIVLTILILVVGKFFHVDVDEKVTEILENLAGADCGGCGCTGCSGFAEKLAKGEANISDCHVTSPENKAEIAKILGVEMKQEEPTVATVRCMGNSDNCARKFEYKGNMTCSSMITLYGGNKACSFGCLGCGDCMASCEHGAITIENGVAKIDMLRCVSCGSCINACPKRIIRRVPLKAQVYVACSSKCRGKDVTGVCKIGCIGCGLCARNCPQKAIKMEDNLPVIDYDLCTGCGTCIGKCPRHVIFSRDVPPTKKELKEEAKKAEEEKAAEDSGAITAA